MSYPRWALDFDGTLRDNIWPSFGEWQPGAVAVMRKLAEYGEVVVHTCRVAPFDADELTPRTPAVIAQEVQEIRNRLDAEGLHSVKVWTKPYKPSAVAYVDDKAVHYNGRKGAWNALLPKLLFMGGIDPTGVIDTEDM